MRTYLSDAERTARGWKTSGEYDYQRVRFEHPIYGNTTVSLDWTFYLRALTKSGIKNEGTFRKIIKDIGMTKKKLMGFGREGSVSRQVAAHLANKYQITLI